MRLISAHIENFGKLSDVSFEFEQGLNVIFHENGWGKSTLAAFIRAMFYGLTGAKNASILNSDRKKYRPWQGGVFGGKLVFEAKGKSYLLTRVFGGTDSEDVFELRDYPANVISTDYGTKIGEELFGIDSASFLRTIFIGQNDMVTNVTDSINSKVGRLLDDSEDLKGYETALTVLNDRLNSLSPTRKTGSISKRRGEITGIDRLVKDGKDLYKNLEELERMTDDLRYRQDEIREKLKENGLVLKKISEAKAVKTIKDHREMLNAGHKAKADALEECRRFFKDKVPTKDEIDGILELSSELVRKEAERDAFKSQHQEEERLKQTLHNAEKDAGMNSMFILGIVLTVLGCGLCMAGLITSSIPFAIAGGAALCIGIVLIVLEKSRSKEKTLNLLNARNAYDQFLEKKNTYDKLDRECKDISDRITGFLNGIGVETEANVNSQLLRLRDRADDYYDALVLEKEALRALSDYEKGNKGVLSQTDYEDLPNENDVEQEKQLLEDELEKNRSLLPEYEARKNTLREQIDEWEDNKETLRLLKEIQQEEKLEYDRKAMAKKVLERAKENMTMRYVGPIIAGFKKYYSMITGESADRFYIDANTKVTIDEAGLQRDTGLFSTGIKDLIGIVLRISLADAMYPDELPMLIMDDPFVNFDDEKLSRVTSFLDMISAKYQILYFTCSEFRRVI